MTLKMSQGSYSDNRLNIADLALWADHIMLRPCDVFLGPEDDHHLERWHIFPRNTHYNVYLHRFLKSDDDRALHDHVGDNTSVLLRGHYIECTPKGRIVYNAGDIVQRLAEDLHRVELINNQPVISLFFYRASTARMGISLS